MKATSIILSLIALTPFSANAHPGHSGHESLVPGLPFETIEWLVVAATIAMVLKFSPNSLLRKQVARNKRPDQRK